MIAGGQGYSLAELALLPLLPVHASGVGPLDSLTGGGLMPGAVWALSGPPSIGVTSLVSSIAVAAASTARVALANEHLPTHLLRDRLRTAGDRIEIASWVPLPDYRSDESGWFGANYDVLIIDCFDEMLRPAAWPKRDTAIRQGRWLRELARRTNTGLVLTARAERPRSRGRRAFEKSWHRHWARPVFDDVADLHVELWPEETGGTRFHATARGRGAVTGSVRQRAGRFSLHAD